MTRKLLSTLLLALMSVSLLVAGGAPARAESIPVATDQTVTYDLTYPTMAMRVVADDPSVTGETLTVTCDPSVAGDFHPWLRAGTAYYLEYIRGDVQSGTTYPIACHASNAVGTTNFTVQLSVVGQAYPGTFHSIATYRLWDTRTDGDKTPFGPNSGGWLQVTGRAGLPKSGVSAVVLNITVTEPTSYGFITAYPYGTAAPTAPNLNYVQGQTVPNAVTVKVGDLGRIAIRNTSSGTAHVIVDVVGYYNAGTPTDSGTFVSVPPSRVLDTRTGNGSTGPVSAGGSVGLTVAGRGGLPAAGLGAVVMNATTEGRSFGFVTAYPSGEPAPNSSNINYNAAQTVPNLVVVKVGADGKVNLKNTSSGAVQLVADVAGYFLAGEAAVPGAFHAMAPTRILDTRVGLGAQGPVAPYSAFNLQVGNTALVPKAAPESAVLNVTVTEPTSAGFLKVYPHSLGASNVSSLNVGPGMTIPNLVTGSVDYDDTLTFDNRSSGTAQYVADLAGYYLFEPPGGATATPSPASMGAANRSTLQRERLIKATAPASSRTGMQAKA